MNQTIDTKKTKDTKKTIQTDQSGEQNQEQRSKQTTMKDKEIQSKQPREQRQENGPKQAKTKSRKRITIVGDSMLNGILDEGLQKDHNVQVKRHPWSNNARYRRLRKTSYQKKAGLHNNTRRHK